MAIGSGLGSQWGFVNESAYGTYVAPTKFRRVKSFAVTREQERPQSDGIQTGVLGQTGAYYVETTNGATGSCAFDVTTRGMGYLLQAITGGTSTSALKSGSAYEQTHTLGDPVGSLTVQGSVPWRDGTAKAKTLTGTKVTSAEFSASTSELLTCSLTLDAQKYDEAQTLAAASYVSDVPFHGRIANLKLGTYNSETALAGVTAVSLTWTRSLDTDDYYYNAQGLKTEPVSNGFVEISGSITADWTSAVSAAIHDRMVANTSTSLVWEFVGTTAISGTDYPTIRFTLPGVFFSGDTQGVDGPDTLSTSYNFAWKYDGTNLPKIYYLTADTAL